MEPLSTQVISDLKACLKLMRSESTETYVFENICEKHFQKYPRPKSDRFSINIFEKPKDTKSIVKIKQRKGQSDNEHVRKNIRNPKRRSSMEQYVVSRLKRDVECLKMKEASNIISFLNKNVPYGYWQERLLAEKVLLTSGESVQLLKTKIREDYLSVVEPEITIGTISVSNFKFTVSKQQTKSDETEFFVLLLSNETEVKVSEVVRCVNGVVVFDEKFTFSVSPSFKIRLQLHSLVMKESPKFFSLGKILKYNCHKNLALTTLQFKNLNTSDFEETKVLKTGFKLCGETEITPSNIHNKTWKLTRQNQFLNEFTTFSTKVENSKIEYRKTGFLTSGVVVKNTTLWNRRWCVLEGHLLKIYGSPSEENIFEPLLVLDLEKCPCEKIVEALRVSCNRPKSFIVEIGGVGSSCSFYFMADSSEELRSWLDSINLILEVLRFKSCYKF